MKAIIIGAGLSGLTLAQALVRAGVDVAIVERDADAESRGQGYRLTIDPVGSDALRACLPDANYAFIRDTAGRSGNQGAFIFLDAQARELHRFVFDTTEGERLGHITGQVDRRTLRQALIAGIEPAIHWGKQFSWYEESATGVVVHCEDGASIQGDVLIGADGSNSRVRNQRLPARTPTHTNRWAVFGRTPIAGEPPAVVSGLLADAGAMSLGPGGRVFFCTAMRFREQPAVVAARLGLPIESPHREDYVMWAIVVPTNAPGSLIDIALRASRVFAPEFQALVERAERDEAVLVPLRALTPAKPWEPGRVTLMGDAIHVMPPFGAHGANTALRDAQSLATHLLSATGDLRDRIGAYEQEMRQYASASVRAAMRMTAMATASFPFKTAIFRAALKVSGA